MSRAYKCAFKNSAGNFLFALARPIELFFWITAWFFLAGSVSCAVYCALTKVLAAKKRPTTKHTFFVNSNFEDLISDKTSANKLSADVQNT